MLLLAAFVAACGASTGDDDDDGSSPTPVDYDAGTWQSEVIVDTPGTISHDIAGVFTNDGKFWGTWMEPDVDATSGEDIWEVSKAPGGGWTLTRLTNDSSNQAAYNQMATDGTTVHLVYNSAPTADNDVFYSKNAGSGWSTRLDVTSPPEAGTPRHDYQTDIALAPNGDALIAYVSASVAGNGGINPDGEIRVARIGANGTPIGTPSLAIPKPTTGYCFDPSIVVDDGGTAHVVADCGPVGNEEIYYSNDASGSFATATPLPGGASRDDYGAHLVLDPDGATLHAVWNADGGDAECMYSSHAGSWSTPVSASNGPSIDDRACSIAVDPQGRVLVAWHQQDSDGDEDVFFSWSADGATFRTPRLVTTGTETSVEWFPDVIALHPDTGVPHLFYEALVAGTNPLNTRIWHAELVP